LTACAQMSLRTSYRLGMSELAVGSLVPASGAAGLAFGAWALRRGGMQVRDIARRTVAFFVLKSAANFVAVAVVGIAMCLGVGRASHRRSRCSRPFSPSPRSSLSRWSRSSTRAAAGRVAPLSPSARASARSRRFWPVAIGASSPARPANGPSTTPSCGHACVRSARRLHSRS
jgi:hypothetical protein